MQVTIEGVKWMFFDRPKVVRAVERARRQALQKAGAFVRRRARSSIRKPRMKPLAAMSEEERRAYRIKQKYWRQGKGPRPARPTMPSRPGEPPRTPTGLLRRTIFYGYDTGTRSVVIGPVKLGRSSGAQWGLEFGGRSVGYGRKKHYVAPRPYMRPALVKEVAAGTIPRAWRDAVRA